MDNNNSTVLALQNFTMSQFAISTGSREISLMIGQTLHLVDPQTGQPTVEGKEWHASYAMSPITAQQLFKALESVLNEYANKFGPIPLDPSFTLDTNNVTHA
jgi:hypothetical protein